MGKPYQHWGCNPKVIIILLCSVLSACENAKDLPLLSRYVAKNVCTAHWIEGYELERAQSLVSNVAPLIAGSWRFDFTDDSVTARNSWFPWVRSRSAQLMESGSHQECRNDYPTISAPLSVDLPLSEPAQSLFETQVEPTSALQLYVDSVLSVGAPEYTTALLVLHGNKVIAEGYRDGITAQSPLKGFSMSKSFANLLVGRMVEAGTIDIYQPMKLPGWESDDRAYITWHNSLRMSSGLNWNEAALGQNNDQGQMFYNSDNPAYYALEKPAAEPAGAGFNYSSGDFMNLSTALVNASDDWFNPGWNMAPFALEFDPAGQYPLLAEGLLLTTRGWAALASIYMNNGMLGDQQVVSEEWVEYSLTPGDTNFDYGAGIWLNWGQNFFPDLPTDTIIFAGSYDRYVVAIPSHDLVFVRIGFSSQPGDFDMQRFVGNAMELVQN